MDPTQPNVNDDQQSRPSSGLLSILRRGVLHLASHVLTDGAPIRPYGQTTLLPIRSIAASVQNEESTDIIAEKLKRWRERKLHEFQFVQVAATLLAAAVIGCFSWSSQAQQEQHWLGPAAWYCSLVLSITAVLLSSAEAFIFSAIKHAPLHVPAIDHSNSSPPGTPRADAIKTRIVPSERLARELSMLMHVEFGENDLNVNNPSRSGVLDDDTEHHVGTLRQVTIRWNMVFTWQAPIMLMGYSVLAFYIGLMIYVCAPLYDGHEGAYLNGPAKAAIVFLVSSAISGAVFLWCTSCAFYYMDWSWTV